MTLYSWKTASLESSPQPFKTHFKDSTPVNLRAFKLFSWKTGKQFICFFKKKKSLNTNTQGELRIFFPSVSMFFQGQFRGSSYLAEKNWSPSKRDHSPHCGLETFPTYRCCKKLLMFFQGPTVCFSRLQRRKTGWWVRFYLSCGMTHSARVSDPEFLSFFTLFIFLPAARPAPFIFQSLGRFPFTISCHLLPAISKKLIIRLFLKS